MIYDGGWAFWCYTKFVYDLGWVSLPFGVCA